MTWIVAQQFQADAQDIINTAAGGIGSQLKLPGERSEHQEHLVLLVALFFTTVLLLLILFTDF